jgi:putative oxidoreductase
MDRMDAALLILRVLIGATMIIHGLNHAFGGGRIAGAARWFESLGLRHGKVQAVMSAGVEVAGGLGMAVGFLTALSAAALIGVMLVAGVTAHRKNGFFIFRDGYEYVLFIAVASLVPAVAGPGRASIDHAIGIAVSGWPGAALAAGLGVAGGAALLGATYRPPERARQPEPAPEPAPQPARD